MARGKKKNTAPAQEATETTTAPQEGQETPQETPPAQQGQDNTPQAQEGQESGQEGQEGREPVPAPEQPEPEAAPGPAPEPTADPEQDPGQPPEDQDPAPAGERPLPYKGTVAVSLAVLHKAVGVGTADMLKAVGTLRQGTEVTVTGRNGPFVQIKNGLWMKESFLEV